MSVQILLFALNGPNYNTEMRNGQQKLWTSTRPWPRFTFGQDRWLKQVNLAPLSVAILENIPQGWKLTSSSSSQPFSVRKLTLPNSKHSGYLSWWKKSLFGMPAADLPELWHVLSTVDSLRAKSIQSSCPCPMSHCLRECTSKKLFKKRIYIYTCCLNISIVFLPL